MGNCATNCSNCMGKDGEHGEFNMDSQAMHVQRFKMTDEGARGLDHGSSGTAGQSDKDYTKLLLS